MRWVGIENGKVDSNAKSVVVEWIDKGGAAFVGTGTSQVPVVTVNPSGGTPYLRTRADRQWTNNLVSLPEF
ncbi:DUF3892 domain-containing protein [Cellulomonas taurus]|uniref:DUF3892 domain-containing protein n=1 Tax=Cellulomonas taurus TaxID=2729175 RepID=UPI00145CC3CF